MIRKVLSNYFTRSSQRHLDRAMAYVQTQAFPRDDFSWSPLAKKRNRAVKRTVDIAAGMVGTAMLIPITLALAPLIKLDSPGDVFYFQSRPGKNGRFFKMRKFRSMKQNADQTPFKAEPPNFKKHDQRITRIGSYLRKSGIDETPQFLCLLEGNMSLVGVRPYQAVRKLQKIAEQTNGKYNWLFHRQRITPGLLKLQFAFLGQHSLNSEEFIALEMYYLGNWSLKMDINLCLRGLTALALGQHH